MPLSFMGANWRPDWSTYNPVPANGFRKAAEDGPNTWALAAKWGIEKKL